MKRALVVGGANGIGLSIATELAAREGIEKVYIVDKAVISKEFMNPKFEGYQFDLTLEDYSIFDKFQYIENLMRIIKRFYGKLEAKDDFYCGVMVSIAGFMSSPFFSIYAATKAALKVFIESVNVELLKGGSTNQILNVSPGSLKGTSFTNGKTDLSVTAPMAQAIISEMEKKNDLCLLYTSPSPRDS